MTDTGPFHRAKVMAEIITTLETATAGMPVSVLAVRVGRHPSVVREMLSVLKASGEAHHVLEEGSRGRRFLWMDGPDPEAVGQACTILPVIQNIIRQFEPILRRDPLVAALFGPAQEVCHG